VKKSSSEDEGVATPSSEQPAGSKTPEKLSVDKEHGLTSTAVQTSPMPAEKSSGQQTPEDMMTPEDEQGASWSGWFSSTINSAKEKSNEMFQFLKQDISEFTETVSEAGRDLKDKLNIEENAKSAVNVVGEKVNVVLEQMSTIFGVGPEDDDEEVIVGNSGRLICDRVQAKIYSLALDEEKFLKKPEGAAYKEFSKNFHIEKKEDEITELFACNPHLQLQYTQLVPGRIDHLQFWCNYYFHVKHILDEEAKHNAAEVQTANGTNSQPSSAGNSKRSSEKTSPLVEIGAAGGDQGMVEISEEDQKRLLAEYEEELKKSEVSGKHSRQSSETQMSSSSSGSFAFVTRDPDTNEPKVDE